jgi:hypothetical protein
MKTNEKIHIDAYWRSLNKENEELCGDRVIIRRSENCFVMVLADGLGSGVKANILSTLTSTIISEMIFEGGSLKDAVETIAATLPECKDRGIAYSTFTIIQIFYSGKASIAEFDNPGAVVMRAGEVLRPVQDVLEYSGRRVTVTHLDMQPGDCIVAFSDGCLHAGVGMTLNFGWGHAEITRFLQEKIEPQDDAREISRILLSNVNYLYQGKPGDDSTVACVKIIEAKETVVMVGPPSRQGEDVRVVQELLSASGAKICCGGTTSEIVARIMNRQVSVDLSQAGAADVPPIGHIEGIDLVTEGVLTLQKTSRYLQKCAADLSQVETTLLSKGDDGALLLTKALLRSSAIKFLVGLSDNPAHDAIAYSPISLNAKIALIKEMAENLKTIGKIVRIEMH